MTSRLVLASTSPYRVLLLERLRLQFDVLRPDVDEAEVPGEAPAKRALRLARAKATAVSPFHRSACVIGSDQVAVVDGRPLHKPGDAAACREQLGLCSGRTAEFYTAVALVRAEPPFARDHVDLTRVRFRTLSEEEIGRYVEAEAPFDCAGGFRSEGLGAALFESIETEDPAALVGLPIIWLASALRAAGLDPLARAQD